MSGRVNNFHYIRHAGAYTEGQSAQVGGIVQQFIASVALSVGDNVYLDTTTNQVTKAAVAANYANKYLGVVVGGRLTGMSIADLSISNNAPPAAGIGNEVLVQLDGIAHTFAGGAIAIGGNVIPDVTTAGRVAAGTTATQVFGNALDAATNAGDKIRLLIRPR